MENPFYIGIWWRRSADLAELIPGNPLGRQRVSDDEFRHDDFLAIFVVDRVSVLERRPGFGPRPTTRSRY